LNQDSKWKFQFSRAASSYGGRSKRQRHGSYPRKGIDIEYEEFGPKTRTPFLLIMGPGAQLTRWPLEFIEILTSRGYRVIRYDNREM